MEAGEGEKEEPANARRGSSPRPLLSSLWFTGSASTSEWRPPAVALMMCQRSGPPGGAGVGAKGWVG